MRTRGCSAWGEGQSQQLSVNLTRKGRPFLLWYTVDLEQHRLEPCRSSYVRGFFNSKYSIIPSCCSVANSCLTLCDPMDCNTPGFPVLHCLPELAQIHVHWAHCAAIKPSHPLLPSSPLAFHLSQIRVFFKEFTVYSGGQIIGTLASALVLPVNIQGWFPSGLTGLISLLSKEISRVFSSITVWKH